MVTSLADVMLSSLACSTNVQVSFSFGGKSWPISTDDMNLGSLGQGLCLGGIFDLTQGSDVGEGNGNPSWVVGDTFLVYTLLTLETIFI